MASAFVILLSAWIQSQVTAQTVVDAPVRADAAAYVAYAYNLKQFGVFSRTPTWTDDHSQLPTPDKLTLPGYPAFLSLFLNGRPDMSFVQRVTTAQMLLGVVTCAVVLLLAFQILPFGWAIAAGVITAISPHLATINTYLLTESLFTLLLAGSLYALVRACADDANRWPYIAAGILLGLASLVRPQLQLLPFVLVLMCALAKPLRPRFPKALLGLACFMVLLAPWQMRNATIERPPGEPDLLVNTLYHGSFPEMMYQGDPRSYGFAYRFDPDRESNTRNLEAVLSHIGNEFHAQPAHTLHWYLLGKPEFFLSWGIIAGAGDIYIYPVLASPYLQSPVFMAIRALAYWLHLPLTLAAITALFLAAWRPSWLAAQPQHRRALRMLATVLAFVILMHMIGAPYPRYGIPFRPLVYLLGVAMLRALCMTLCRRTTMKAMDLSGESDLQRQFSREN